MIIFAPELTPDNNYSTVKQVQTFFTQNPFKELYRIHIAYNIITPGIELVQALADILHSAIYASTVYKAISSQAYICVCCHSNKTRAPIANLPNSAQIEGSPYNSPKLHPGPCSSVGMRR